MMKKIDAGKSQRRERQQRSSGGSEPSTTVPPLPASGFFSEASKALPFPFDVCSEGISGDSEDMRTTKWNICTSVFRACARAAAPERKISD